MKDTYGRVLLLVKLLTEHRTVLKVILFQGYFHVFLIVQMVLNYAKHLIHLWLVKYFSGFSKSDLRDPCIFVT